MKNPDFEEAFHSHDIVYIQDTEFDKFDSIDLLGPKCLPILNKRNAKVRSGGIAILFKELLYNSITVLENGGDTFTS